MSANRPKPGPRRSATGSRQRRLLNAASPSQAKPLSKATTAKPVKLRGVMDADTVKRCEHAGMALARIAAPNKDEQTSTEVLDPFLGKKLPAPYVTAFERWCQISENLPGAIQHVVKARTSLAIGTSNFSPVENGLSLNATWGVPYLPGSALKGLACKAASMFSVTEAETEVMFGTTSVCGYVNFNDGWLLPDNPQAPILALDIMTPHANDYYSSQGKIAPDDFQEPTPIAFLVVPKGSRFLVTLDCPEDGNWAEAAMSLLEFGLTKLGLGGMTSSGYGRFDVTMESPTP